VNVERARAKEPTREQKKPQPVIWSSKTLAVSTAEADKQRELERKLNPAKVIAASINDHVVEGCSLLFCRR
jgi:hypothetical protein